MPGGVTVSLGEGGAAGAGRPLPWCCGPGEAERGGTAKRDEYAVAGSWPVLGAGDSAEAYSPGLCGARRSAGRIKMLM